MMERSLRTVGSPSVLCTVCLFCKSTSGQVDICMWFWSRSPKYQTDLNKLIPFIRLSWDDESTVWLNCSFNVPQTQLTLCEILPHLSPVTCSPAGSTNTDAAHLEPPAAARLWSSGHSPSGYTAGRTWQEEDVRFVSPSRDSYNTLAHLS